MPKAISREKLKADCQCLVESWREDPGAKLRREGKALALAFIPHKNNNHAEKAISLGFFGVWGAILLGVAYGQADLALDHPLFIAFTALVFGIVGRIWGIQVNSLPGLEVSVTDGSSEDDAEEPDRPGS